MGYIILVLCCVVLCCVVAYKIGYFHGSRINLPQSPLDNTVCYNRVSSEYLAAMGAADFEDAVLDGDQTPEGYLKSRGL